MRTANLITHADFNHCMYPMAKIELPSQTFKWKVWTQAEISGGRGEFKLQQPSVGEGMDISRIFNIFLSDPLLCAI